jgi:hypothetical protein
LSVKFELLFELILGKAEDGKKMEAENREKNGRATVTAVVLIPLVLGPIKNNNNKK